MSTIIELNKDNFEQEVLKSDKPVVVKFYRASGCGNCTKVAPIFEEFAAAYPDIKCAQYVCGSAPDEVSSKYPFRMFPGIFFFQKGEVVGSIEGFVNLEQLKLPFLSSQELKSMVYDRMQLIEMARGAEKEVEMLNNLILGKVKSEIECVRECEGTCAVTDSLCKSECKKWCEHINVIS